jgi:hypothetical protein
MYIHHGQAMKTIMNTTDAMSMHFFKLVHLLSSVILNYRHEVVVTQRNYHPEYYSRMIESALEEQPSVYAQHHTPRIEITYLHC